jgi:hypothetical protein
LNGGSGGGFRGFNVSSVGVGFYGFNSSGSGSHFVNSKYLFFRFSGGAYVSLSVEQIIVNIGYSRKHFFIISEVFYLYLLIATT